MPAIKLLKPQAQAILAELTRNTGRWVSGNDLLRNYCTAYSQRIGEIKKYGKALGFDWLIESRRMKGSTVYEYRLVSRDEVAA